jgi:FKBP-type peptidyl-prolyl cis-trans isomerase 2
MRRLRIATLLLILLLINIAITGCLEDDEKKTPKTQLSIIGGSHKVYAGDTTTYLLLVKNNRDENDTFSLSTSSVPSGWDVNLNITSFNVSKKSSFGIFVVVESAANSKTGEHKIKITAESITFDIKKSLTIKTKVISQSGEKVIIGDKVSVKYFGYLSEFKVFDTSISDIGEDKAIQKTSSFAPNKAYEPLQVQVSAEDPDDQDPYISTVEGFWEGLVGMRVGQSRTIHVPPDKGYANYENATVNTTEEIPMLETMTVSDFNLYYPNEDLIEGVVMAHHFWQWNVSILYVNQTEDIVRIINEPRLNQKVAPYGWDTEVIYKNQSDNDGEGLIIVRNDPEEGMEAVYQNFPAEVLTVGDDEIGIRYNNSPHELANELMIFELTLVDIVG